MKLQDIRDKLAQEKIVSNAKKAFSDTLKKDDVFELMVWGAIKAHYVSRFKDKSEVPPGLWNDYETKIRGALEVLKKEGYEICKLK